MNWCFWTMVLEKTLKSPLDCKEIQLVHPKGNQYWVSIGRTDVEAETPILWPPDGKDWEDPDAGKDWRREEKGMTEDEMVGWHHWPMHMSLSKLWGLVMQAMGLQRVGHDWVTELNWWNHQRKVFYICSLSQGVVYESMQAEGEISLTNRKTRGDIRIQIGEVRELPHIAYCSVASYRRGLWSLRLLPCHGPLLKVRIPMNSFLPTLSCAMHKVQICSTSHS